VAREALLLVREGIEKGPGGGMGRIAVLSLIIRMRYRIPPVRYCYAVE
jgi:hypothetical protein